MEVDQEYKNGYYTLVQEILDEADRAGPRMSSQWRGMLSLGCVINGMCLVPYDSVEASDRASYWAAVKVADNEFFLIVERNRPA